MCWLDTSHAGLPRSEASPRRADALTCDAAGGRAECLQLHEDQGTLDMEDPLVEPHIVPVADRVLLTHTHR